MVWLLVETSEVNSNPKSSPKFTKASWLISPTKSTHTSVVDEQKEAGKLMG